MPQPPLKLPGLLALTLTFAAPLTTAPAASAESPGRHHTPQMSYVDNGVIRLGIDLNLGGAITYLSLSGTNPALNVINSYDWGRQVQLSYYSGPVPFAPSGAQLSPSWAGLGWNPIQAGDCFGHTSKILQHTNDGQSLYVSCVPMQWPLENVPGECDCEVWLALDGPVVKARCRLNNHRSDHTQFTGRNQELPAVYVNGPFHRLMTYRGEKPFTRDTLSRIEERLDKDGHWGHWTGTENWAAEVNDAGWGLGIWSPEVCVFDGGFAGEPGKGGPFDGPTGYLGPVRPEIIDYNIVYDYRYELILGSLESIRDYVYQHAQRPAAPAWRFDHDRQGWHYRNATDAGWPIRGELDIRLEQTNPQLVSPVFFARADAVAKLILDAAFGPGCEEVAVAWRKFGHEADFSGVVAQRVTADGQFHRVEINLAESPGFGGSLTQIRIDPKFSVKTSRLRLRSVSFGEK